MNYLLTLDTNLVNDMIGAEVLKIRQDKEDNQDEWINDHAHDITGCSWMDQDNDEWGDKCICIAGGGSHACYLEVEYNKLNGNHKYRFNYPCKKIITSIDKLWVVNYFDAEYITEYDPTDIFEDDEYMLI